MALSPKTLQALERLLHLPPHNSFLGLALGNVEDEAITTELVPRDEFIGDVATGALHGGVLSSMLDATCSLAVMVKLGRLIRVTTLDLRVDYLVPVTSKAPLRTRCICNRLTEEIAFVTGTTSQINAEGQEIEVAKASGSFLIIRARSGVEA